MFQSRYSPLEASLDCLSFDVAKQLTDDLDASGECEGLSTNSSPTISLFEQLQRRGTPVGELIRRMELAGLQKTAAYRKLSEFTDKGLHGSDVTSMTQDASPGFRAPSHYIHQRSREISQINATFAALRNRHPTGVITVSLTGGPGSGKSVLASQFANTLDRTAIICTIQTKSLVTLNNSLTVLAFKLFSATSDIMQQCGGVEDADRKMQLLFTAIRKRLVLSSNWFLIFDDVSEEMRDLIRSYWPEPGCSNWGTGAVLVTSQRPVLQNVSAASVIDVGEKGMEEMDAVQLAMKISNINNSEKCREAVEKIGRLPLSLSNAALWVRMRNESDWRSCTKEFQKRRECDSDCSKQLASCIAFAHAIASENQILRLVFLLMGCLAADPVPMDCILEFVKNWVSTKDEQVEKEIKLCPALQISSSDTSLITTVSLHEVFHAALTRQSEIWIQYPGLGPSTKASLVCGVLKALIASYNIADGCGEIETRYTLRRAHFSHFNCIVSLLQSLCIPDRDYHKTLGEAYFVCADIYDLEGHYARRLEYLQKSLSYFESFYGFNRKPLAPVLLQLGCALTDVGRRTEAIDALEECLQLQRINGTPLPAIARTLFSIGLLCIDMCNYRKALRILRECLRIRKENIDKPKMLMHVGATLTGMGQAHLDLRQFGKAKACFEEALDVKEKAVGKMSPTYATTLLHLGRYYLRISDAEKAVKILMEAVRIRCHFLGDRHGLVLMAKVSLGRALGRKGEVEKSIKVLEEVVETYERLCADTYDIELYSGALLNLANSLVKRNGEGDLIKAEKLTDRAFPLQEKFYGKWHYELIFLYRTRATIFMMRYKRNMVVVLAALFGLVLIWIIFFAVLGYFS